MDEIEGRSPRPGPRKERGYFLLRATRVRDDAWMSQPEAARTLGVSALRVAMLLANGRLTPAENQAGHAGVTGDSVHAEESWRAQATRRAKLTRLLIDAVGYF
ncbi:DNA-binding protein [Streptomyces asoensis]|uniref:DNA-binding protein n=2 Tax=Streptomyces asoensis TaxID=249586 RepID=UPI0033E41B0A